MSVRSEGKIEGFGHHIFEQMCLIGSVYIGAQPV
jgi:hypothetical protein